MGFSSGILSTPGPQHLVTSPALVFNMSAASYLGNCSVQPSTGTGVFPILRELCDRSVSVEMLRSERGMAFRRTAAALLAEAARFADHTNARWAFQLDAHAPGCTPQRAPFPIPATRPQSGGDALWYVQLHGHDSAFGNDSVDFFRRDGAFRRFHWGTAEFDSMRRPLGVSVGRADPESGSYGQQSMIVDPEGNVSTHAYVFDLRGARAKRIAAALGTPNDAVLGVAKAIADLVIASGQYAAFPSSRPTVRMAHVRDGWADAAQGQVPLLFEGWDVAAANIVYHQIDQKRPRRLLDITVTNGTGIAQQPRAALTLWRSRTDPPFVRLAPKLAKVLRSSLEG